MEKEQKNSKQILVLAYPFIKDTYKGLHRTNKKVQSFLHIPAFHVVLKPFSLFLYVVGFYRQKQPETQS